MAISTNIQDLELKKFKESTTTSGQPGVVVINSDGSSIGGGTQYTEGDTDASITGTAFLWEDASNTLKSVSASSPLPVTNATGLNVTDDAVGVRPDDYAVDDSAMPATPRSLPIAGEYRASPTTYADGDATVMQTDVNGNLKVKAAPPDFDVASHTAKAVKYYTSAGAATDGIIWSPAGGKRWHVTTLVINVSAAATVTIEDDLAAGDNAIMKMELAANSGVVIPFGDLYPLTSGEDAADLLITTSAGNVYVTAVGYEI